MTQKAAICEALLKGEVLSVMTAFRQFGCTNISREVGRSIEREFGIIVSRMSKPFKSRYGHVGVYFEYRLNPLIKCNKEGIKKMRAYVDSQKKCK